MCPPRKNPGYAHWFRIWDFKYFISPSIQMRQRQISEMYTAPQAVVYTGFRGWGGGPGEIKNFAFLQTRKFSKNVKKSMKIFYFFENLHVNFAIF